MKIGVTVYGYEEIENHCIRTHLPSEEYNEKRDESANEEHEESCDHPDGSIYKDLSQRFLSVAIYQLKE